MRFAAAVKVDEGHTQAGFWRPICLARQLRLEGVNGRQAGARLDDLLHLADGVGLLIAQAQLVDFCAQQTICRILREGAVRNACVDQIAGACKCSRAGPAKPADEKSDGAANEAKHVLGTTRNQQPTGEKRRRISVES